MFASVGVIIGVKNDALLVPESALGREGDIEYVWVVMNGKSGRKRVLTGTKENGQVEIVAGLRPGEIVVTSGQLKLGEGTAVKISNMEGNDVEVLEDDEDAETTNATQKEGTPKKDEDAPSGAPTPSTGTGQEGKNSNAANATPSPEEQKPLPSPSQSGSPEKEEEAKVASLEKPSEEDKVSNASTKATEKPSGGASQGNAEPKKSFVAKVWGKVHKVWEKVHDFVIRKFREIKGTS